MSVTKTSGLVADLDFDLAETNQRLENVTAQERVSWAVEQFDGGLVLSSSFGIQAAVMLHLVSEAKPDIPVIFVDTGYLFPETYKFAEQLTNCMDLNLKMYRARRSSSWQEAIDGCRWEYGLEGIEAYNQENKVEPMERALEELQATSWLAGLRRQQSKTREDLPVLALAGGRVKIHPIIDWTNKTVHEYLKANELPYHPLWDQGYVSVGDKHSTRKLEPGMTEADTRHNGIKRECGLHEGVSTDFTI